MFYLKLFLFIYETTKVTPQGDVRLTELNLQKACDLKKVMNIDITNRKRFYTTLAIITQVFNTC